MQQSDYKIGTRLRAGFALMLFLTLVLGGLALFQIRNLSDLTEQIFVHPFTVNMAERDIRDQARIIEITLADLDPGVPLSTVEVHQHEIAVAEKTALELFALVGERYLGPKADVERCQASFQEWSGLIDEAITAHLHGLGRDEQVRAVVKARNHLQKFLSTVQTIISFSNNKAKAFHEEALHEKDFAYLFMGLLLAVLVLTGGGVAALITRGIALPLHQVVARLKDVAAGKLGDDLEMQRQDEIGQLADAFRDMRAGLKAKAVTAQAVAAGDLYQEVAQAGERDVLGQALEHMIQALRRASEAIARNDWLKTGKNELALLLIGDIDLRTLSDRVLRFLAPYLNAQIGALYALTEADTLVLTGSYAVTRGEGLPGSFHLGQGLVGQAAAEGRLISVTELPGDYLRVNSALGQAEPRHIVVVPLLHEGRVKAVLELGSFEELTPAKLELLDIVAESIAQAVNSVENQKRLRELLDQTRLQAETLQNQQEELRSVNEELEQQALALRSSEEELRQQQEELQVANEELAEKNTFLERQKSEISLKNVELDSIRQGLEHKARELELSSQYKSEFLANMSHELRTPLNSLLLLSRNLMDNPGGNLSADQVEYARIIFRSGNDLLSLISEILDLSKIEAGKMTFTVDEVSLSDLAAPLLATFKPMADEKGLALTVDLDGGLPGSLRTDAQRVEQILRNLLSNAIKFCDQGGISVRFHRPEPDWRLRGSGLSPDKALAVSVTDTGVGIPEERQQEIFEAFQQAEGGTARRYGGTGLGLTISRELAHLLGGEILLQSVAGQGSTFTLVLPLDFQPCACAPGREGVSPAQGRKSTLLRSSAAPAKAPKPDQAPDRLLRIPSFADDRACLRSDEPSILIIEDDPDFARILADNCHAKGFQVLATASGEEGLELARLTLPSAIILDIKLPGMNGQQVLDELKNDPALRHIPVHVMSVLKEGQDALLRGAVGFLSKPTSREGLDQAFGRMEQIISKKIKDLLLVEDDADLRRAVIELIADPEVNIIEAASGGQAMALLHERRFDCMILDLGLPDMSGFELLERLEAEVELSLPPVIVYTGRELSREEECRLRDHADSIIIKGVRSEERLIDETALFLHQMVKTLPRRKRDTILNLYDKDAVFKDATVLLVDDDMRNLFALAQVLQDKGVTAIKAEDGQKALEILNREAKVDLVLMDIMMPGMDGYEATRQIRAQARFKNLPIIALTAKAMLADREQCMAAGASDYLSKPVDLERLLSVMRVWLHK